MIRREDIPEHLACYRFAILPDDGTLISADDWRLEYHSGKGWELSVLCDGALEVLVRFPRLLAVHGHDGETAVLYLDEQDAAYALKVIDKKAAHRAPQAEVDYDEALDRLDAADLPPVSR